MGKFVVNQMKMKIGGVFKIFTIEKELEGQKSYEIDVNVMQKPKIKL
jgi:hypothetical protein